MPVAHLVYPELVDYDHDGKLLTVRYLEFNAMLLNELQKQGNQLQKLARETQELAQRLQTKDRQLAAHQREIDAFKQQNASINALSQRLAVLERQVQTSTSQGMRSLASK
jgi:flagellar biosynthesis/type III secretory pathway chaperone